MTNRTHWMFLAVAAAAAMAQPDPAENYADWNNFRVFSINTMSNGANLSSGTVLTGYPLLLRLNASNAGDVFSGAKHGGADLRFRRAAIPTNPPLAKAAANGEIQLPYEIEHWDSAGQSAAIWVLVDSVYGNRNTQTLAMHWGKPDAPAQSSAAAVFDSANGFVGVWHLGGTSPASARPNAVPGGNPAVPSGANVATGFPTRLGLIGRADTLRGGASEVTQASDDHFNLGTGYDNFAGGMTLSAWIKPAPPSSTGWNVYIGLGNGAPGDNLTIGRMATGGGTNLFSEAFNGTTGGGRTEMNAAVFNQWQLVAFTAKGLEQALYYNGNYSSVSRTTAITIPNVNRTLAYLGRSLWASDPNAAVSLDEVRIQRVERSAGWLQMDYATQRANPNVLSVVAPPLTPPLSSPAANATNVPILANLAWAGIGGATAYRLQIATDSLFTASLVDLQLAATSYVATSLSFATAYYWRVRSLGESGTSGWSGARRFTTESASAAVPAAPTLASPAAFASSVPLGSSLAWQSVPGGVTAYHAQLATVPTFATRVMDDSGIAATQRAVSLSGNTEYYWRVRARNAAGIGPWSEVRAFTTTPVTPAAPNLVSPAAFATNVPAAGPTLQWSASPGAVSYRVQVSLVPEFTAFVVNDTGTGTSRTLGPLAGYTNYYWRVSAKNSAGTSAYSSPRLFTTGEPVGIRAQGARITPLRLREGRALRIELARAERISVRLRDPRGRETSRVWEGALPAGTHTLALPDFPGIRILEFRAEEAARTLLLAP